MLYQARLLLTAKEVMMMTSKQEIWHQDPFENDLWMNEDGLLVNTAALEERTYYVEVVRVPVQPVPDHELVGEYAL
jgi:hypothetical protein